MKCLKEIGFKSTIEKAELELDAHHITSRKQMPNGGYVKENGISLCKKSPSCHEKAESVLLGEKIDNFTPEALYAKIASSYEEALIASKNLQ